MSGTRCAIYGCNNTYDTNKNRENERKIIMHAFPRKKDLMSQTIREEWIIRCSRRDKFNPNNSRICSEHFAVTDYERDLEHELLGLPLRKILKKTAVPTIGIMKNSEQLDSTCNQDKKEAIADLIVETAFKEKQQKQKVMEDMTNLVAKANSSENELKNVNTILGKSNSCIAHFAPILKSESDNIATADADDMTLISLSTSGTSYPANIEDDKEKYAKLLEEHDNLKAECRQMEQNLKKKIKNLHDQVRYFRTKSFKSPKLKKAQIDAQTLLKKVFTENQIRLLLNKKKRVNWTNEEISVALTLRYYSKNCYLFLKNKLHYPLPSLATLKKKCLKKKL